MSFTREELESFYVPQLRNLAEYYGIKLKSKMLKGDIIDKILEETKEIEEIDEIPASVRIRRIRESQKE
jgi:hypothetical protein